MAIGSSGDRPDALARLKGIVLNDGVQLPTVDVERGQFAADTPEHRSPSQRIPAQYVDAIRGRLQGSHRVPRRRGPRSVWHGRNQGRWTHCYWVVTGAPGRTAATPSGLMLKARNVKGSLPGLPHWCTRPNGS